MIRNDTQTRRTLAAIAVATAHRQIPLHVLLELTPACNLRCIHCYCAPGGQRPLNGEEVEGLLEQLAAAGTLHLSLTGGEAMMRPDFFDILRSARRLHFALNVLTNGTLIGPAEADALAAVGPWEVGISIYGPTAVIHDRVTRVPGSFERTKRGATLGLVGYGEDGKSPRHWTPGSIETRRIEATGDWERLIVARSIPAQIRSVAIQALTESARRSSSS